jgi:hypothetical protein
VKKGDTIVIESAANGFIVRPQVGRDQLYLNSDVCVFNDMGTPVSDRDGQKTEETLLGWIAAHFSKAP